VKLGLLKNYADSYNSMTGEQAEDYIRKRGEAEQSIMQLRLKYIPAFRKVLTGREVALTCSWYKCRSSIRNRPTHFPCCYRVLPMRPIDRPRSCLRQYSFSSLPGARLCIRKPEDKSSCMDARSEREYNNRR
jgi:hypothetical protein